MAETGETVAEPDGVVRYSTVGNHNTTNDARRGSSGCCIRLLSLVSLALAVTVIALVLYIVVNNENSTLLSPGGGSDASMNYNNNNMTAISWLPLPSSEKALTKLAFGSCARQDMPQPYWDTLMTYKPELVLLMGDNIYGDCHEETCQRLRQAYADFGAHPSVQGFARHVPVFATLDDHDYGQSDCHADNPYKNLARQMFVDFFAIPDSDLPDDGVYRSASFGPEGQRLQVILLDTRYSRSPFVETGDRNAPYQPANDTMEQHMLSEAQWTWLAQQLEEPADLRILVSSIQVLNDVVPFEGWRHLPKERNRLYDLIKDKSLLLLSGDRHVGGFYEFSSIREVTASSWTHTIPLGAYGSNCSTSAECDEVDPRRIGDLVRFNHFGSLEIDWKHRTFVVALRRTETTYGVSYFHEYESDAGFVLQSMNYSF